MAITTGQGLSDALRDTARACGVIKPTISGAANSNVDMTSLSAWSLASVPPAGATPVSGVTGDVPTSATTGAIPFVNPAAGNTYLARLQAKTLSTTITADTWSIYDRLWHNSGISSTLTTSQSIVSVALTRPDALGTAAEAWYQVYATMGAGTPVVTLTYTNQAGTAGKTATTVTLTTTMATNRTGQFQLASGDTGVRAIAAWQANATFTSGTIGLVIRRHVATMKVVPDLESYIDAVSLGMPRVYDNACLETIYRTHQNQTPNLTGSITLIQG